LLYVRLLCNSLNDSGAQMRNLKLTIAYDGSAFHGWQVQPGKPTIQGTLADAIESLTGEKLLPQGSGRTDAGVHALAQVATFQTESSIPTANFRIVLNDRLPAAIRVLAVDEMADDFHARHSARAKCYHYRIWRGDVVPPFLARYVTHHPYPLNETAMQQSAALVAGEHDFTSFAAVDPDRALRLAGAPHLTQSADMGLCPHQDGSTSVGESDRAGKHTTNIRTIHESRFERHAEELLYIVRGNGFLHHMVRNLVGTFLLVGKGGIAPSAIPQILEARDRRAAGPTAPAEGLYLVEVEY
jgi:tRNA pseudouridine38-40 synthase